MNLTDEEYRTTMEALDLYRTVGPMGEDVEDEEVLGSPWCPGQTARSERILLLQAKLIGLRDAAAAAEVTRT